MDIYAKTKLLSDPYVLFLVMMAMVFDRSKIPILVVCRILQETFILSLVQVVSEEKSFKKIVDDDNRWQQQRRQMPSDDNSSTGLWPGELKSLFQGEIIGRKHVMGILVFLILQEKEFSDPQFSFSKCWKMFIRNLIYQFLEVCEIVKNFLLNSYKMSLLRLNYLEIKFGDLYFIH